jgi:hypothetical protein
MYLRKLLVLFVSLQVLSLGVDAAELNDSKLLEDSVTDMYTVAGAGLGGAVLGLSTLSFVEEPGDHLKNILVGAALGIMGGVAFVGYSTANKGRDLYYDGASLNKESKTFSTKKRVAWHRKEMGKVNFSSKRELPFFVWFSRF